jgi:hypothetical protein
MADERWGNSRHKLHRQKRQTTSDVLSVAQSLPVKPFTGTPPRNFNSIPPAQRNQVMRTDAQINALKRRAEQILAILALPDARALKGATWCDSEAILIQMSLSSITQNEALERLEKQLSNIQTQLEGK